MGFSNAQTQDQTVDQSSAGRRPKGATEAAREYDLQLVSNLFSRETGRTCSVSYLWPFVMLFRPQKWLETLFKLSQAEGPV